MCPNIVKYIMVISEIMETMNIFFYDIEDCDVYKCTVSFYVDYVYNSATRKVVSTIVQLPSTLYTCIVGTF